MKLQGESIHVHYGVPASFEIRRVRQLRRGLVGKALWHWWMRRAVRRHEPALVYGRDIRGLLAVARSGVPLVCEAHFLPDRIHLYEELFAMSNFERLVVISQALRDDFTASYPDLDPRRMKVEHDVAPRALRVHVPRQGDPGVRPPRPARDPGPRAQRTASSPRRARARSVLEGLALGIDSAAGPASR